MKLNGIGVTPFKCLGRAVILKPKTDNDKTPYLPKENPEEELLYFETTLESLSASLLAKHEQLKEQGKDTQSALFKMQNSIVNDFLLIKDIKNNITNHSLNAVHAVTSAVAVYIKKLGDVSNKYIQERVVDLEDVADQLILRLKNIQEVDLSSLKKPYVLVADDISPSLISGLSEEYLQGIITCKGSTTSHTAIIANILGIAGIMGCEDALHIPQDSLVFVNGEDGTARTVNSAELAYYENLMKDYEKLQQELEVYKNLPTKTKDHTTIDLCINIADSNVPNKVLENNPDGVGLFRTEFIYMDRPDLPSEDEQYSHYLSIAKKFSPRPVIIRTMDIGGDKNVDSLNIPKEDNPFLGYRAIRISLDRKDIFGTQLRALLRANELGNIKIMYPMIAEVQELVSAKAFLNETRACLLAEGIQTNLPLQGIMVETPSAAILASTLIEHCDFFSIGSNDLTQYTLAVDRMNVKIAPLYNHFSPAVIRLISTTCQAANTRDKLIGLCGEMAGDPLAVPLLIGLGVKELSVSPSKLLSVRALIRKINYADACRVAKEVLKSSNPQDTENILKDYAATLT